MQVQISRLLSAIAVVVALVICTDVRADDPPQNFHSYHRLRLTGEQANRGSLVVTVWYGVTNGGGLPWENIHGELYLEWRKDYDVGGYNMVTKKTYEKLALLPRDSQSVRVTISTDAAQQSSLGPYIQLVAVSNHRRDLKISRAEVAEP